jgi:hypothetical protein
LLLFQWSEALSSNAIVRVEDVEQLLDSNNMMGQLNGAMRLRYDDDRLGQMKLCDAIPGGSWESWKAEVIAYAIDRLFGVHRTPPVVLRIVKPFALPTNPARPNTTEHLRQVFARDRCVSLSSILRCRCLSWLSVLAKFRCRQVKRLCQNKIDVFYGSIMGWTKYPVVVMHGYSEKLPRWFFKFDLNMVTQHQVEFSRLLVRGVRVQPNVHTSRDEHGALRKREKTS